jgi:hypothetical protein
MSSELESDNESVSSSTSESESLCSSASESESELISESECGSESESESESGRRLAICFGNNVYADAPLKSCRKDAEDMSKILVDFGTYIRFVEYRKVIYRRTF